MTDLLDRARLRRSMPDAKRRKSIRHAAGISQAELAQLIGVNPRTIARWEGAAADPTSTNFASYIKALDQLSNAL